MIRRVVVGHSGGEVHYAGSGKGSFHAWATHWMPLPKGPAK